MKSLICPVGWTWGDSTSAAPGMADRGDDGSGSTLVRSLWLLADATACAIARLLLAEWPGERRSTRMAM